MITDKKECARFLHIDLHSHQPGCVARKMVKGDALAKVQSLLIKRFPVPFLRERSKSYIAFQAIGRKRTYRLGLR